MTSRLMVAAACLNVLIAAPLPAQSRVAELNDTGWQLLQGGDGARAATIFARALALEPDHPVLLFGAGVAAHLRGRSQDATARLRRALERDPSLTPAAMLLGQIQYKNGEIAAAISTYESALGYAPGEPQLMSLLEAWRADAEATRGFVERRLDRFRVMFQGHADETLAARATDLLEAAFWRIGKRLGAYPSDQVIVMLYTERQFRDVTRAPEWAGGLYDGRIRVPAAGAAQSPALFERVLIHELAHAMIASVAPRGVPAWLHEGLAQHFEGDDPAAARRRLEVAGGVIPFRYLEVTFSRLTAPEAAVAYDQSLVAVDRLLQRPDVDWSSLFRALAESGRMEYTLDQFGLRYADLEAELAGNTLATPAAPSR